jgi:hemerythrin-like domain-containing protein
MNDPIAMLMGEHRLFERLLDALDRWADQLAGSPDQTLARRDLEAFTVLLADLVDAHHHGKEEDILFAAMVDAGFPAQGGPIAVMLHEHDLGRSHVRALRELTALPSLPVGPAKSYVQAFGDLLRAHIQKEDHILYPIALRILGPAMTEVGARCERYESTPETQARLGALMATANELLSRYGPT